MTTRTEALYDVIRLVRPLYKVLEAAVALELAETGISVPQRAVLEQVLDAGPLTVPAIGRRLVLPRQFVQKTANELLDASLLAKRENAAHKRSALLALTPAGLAAITGIKAREAAVMQPIARALDKAEVETTRATLQEIIRAFRAHNAQGKGQQEGDST